VSAPLRRPVRGGSARSAHARWRPLGIVLGCTLVAGLFASCTSARSNLGTSDSSCYLALPSATDATGGHGRFLGVHLMTLRALRTNAPHLYGSLETGRPLGQQVCVVAFTGKFTSQSVEMPRGNSSGRFAVVVETTPTIALVGTVISARAPLPFRANHFD
jgi:hypothetical protein